MHQSELLFSSSVNEEKKQHRLSLKPYVKNHLRADTDDGIPTIWWMEIGSLFVEVKGLLNNLALPGVKSVGRSRFELTTCQSLTSWHGKEDFVGDISHRISKNKMIFQVKACDAKTFGEPWIIENRTTNSSEDEWNGIRETQ